MQALVDVQNLTELLSESPDIIDIPNAKTLTKAVTAAVAESVTSTSDITPLFKGAKVEFRDISFHYPEQPAEKGLKHVCFTVAPGSTTGIVGGTGAGKLLSRKNYSSFFTI